jgi:diacylglycerol kinase (ATP)
LRRCEAAVLHILRATRNTWNGLVSAARGETAFRQELVVLLLAIPLAFVIAESAWRRLALIAVLVVLLVVELLNTAIEKLADQVTRETHPAIGRVKDMGSAAVGLSLLLAASVWLLAFGEYFGLL